MCCYFIDETGKKRKCRYLVKIGNLSHCRIYKKRLGVVHYKSKDQSMSTMCILREEIEFDYPGCSYNKDRPMHPMYKEEVKKDE